MEKTCPLSFVSVVSALRHLPSVIMDAGEVGFVSGYQVLPNWRIE
jgi:hypothetical protein